MEKKFTLILLTMLLLNGFSIKAQPVFLKVLPTSSANFISANGQLYFTTGTDSLWRSNGTPSGTIFVKKINETVLNVFQLTVGTFFYFTTQEPGGNVALWKSNGTGVNTFKIRSAPVINPLITYHGSLYMGIDDGVHGYELWRVTSANLFSLVRDINPGSGSGLGSEIVVFGDYLYFKANSGTGGINIWKSNGTSVTVLAVNPAFDEYNQLTVVDTLLYFVRYYESGYQLYREIWKTNGTEAGTSVVIQYTEDNSCILEVTDLINYHHQLYFDFITGCGTQLDYLAKSNGTMAGTELIKRINIDGYVYSPFLIVNDQLVFHGSSQSNPGQMFRSDGTEGGTVTFHQFRAEPTRKFAVVGDLLFFADHASGSFPNAPNTPEDWFQLWQSDLTAVNTRLVRDIYGGSYAGANNLTNANGKLFFTTFNEYPFDSPTDPVLRLYILNPSVALKQGAFNIASSSAASEFDLSVYPNPSIGSFKFSVTSASSGNVVADIFKLDGTFVKRICETITVEGKMVEFGWDGENASAGIYICKYNCGSDLKIKKIVLKK